MTPSSITACSSVKSCRIGRGAISVAAMNSMPNSAPTIVAALMTFLMGSVLFCPQYCAPKTTRPSPTPLTIICSKNWIWLTSATPESAFSLYAPIITLSARFTLYTIRFCSAMKASIEKNGL